MNLGHYAKSLVAVLVAGLAALQGYLDDGLVTSGEWELIGSALLTAAAVWVFPNQPKPPTVANWPDKTFSRPGRQISTE